MKLIIDNLSFRFRAEETLLFDHLNATFNAGEVSIIHGRNGTGKSTLMRILAGIQLPSECISGNLKLGQSSHSLPFSRSSLTEYQKRVRAMPQQVDLMLADQLTGRQNLALASTSRYPGLFPIEKNESLSDSIAYRGIDLDKSVYLLSGGQRQLLALSMLTQSKPKLILLDEPTAALDPRNAAMVMEKICAIAKEQKIIAIMIMHDHELIKQHARESRFMLHHDTEAKRCLLTREE